MNQFKVIKLYPGRLPKWLRWLIWLLLFVLLLPVLLLLALQTRPVQELVRAKAEKYLEDKLETNVSIGRLHLVWFTNISIERIYVADRLQQPLLYSGSLSIKYDLLALLRNRLVIREVNWDKVLVNVYTGQDKRQNYQFILDSFIGDTTAVTAKDTSGTPLQLEIGRVKITKLKLRYIDDASGLNTIVRLGRLLVNAQTIDPSSNLFAFRNISVDSLDGVLRQAYRPAPIQPSGEGSAAALLLRAKLLKLTRSSFTYTDEGSGIHTGWDLDELNIKLAMLDLAAARIRSGDILLTKPTGFLQKGTAVDTNIAIDSNAMDSNAQNWTITTPAINITDANFRYDDLNAPSTKYQRAFDYGHFHLAPLQLAITDLRYSDTSIAASLQQLQVRDITSGFIVRSASADIQFSDKGALLNRLLLETNESRIAQRLEVKLSSWKDMKTNLPATTVDADFRDTRLVLAEALYFIPEYRSNKDLAGVWNKTVVLNGRISGTLESLSVNGLQFTDNAGNRIQASGTIRNVTDPDRLFAQLNNVNIGTGNRAIRSWLPEGILPPDLNLPEQLSVKGMFAGGMKDATTDLQVKSSFGQADFKGRLKNYNDKQNSIYDLDLRNLSMDIGKWIRDTSIGRVVARGKIKGRGFDYRKLKADADLHIASARYRGYDYSDIDISAALDQGNYRASVASTDSNLAVRLQLAGNLSDSFPTVAGGMKVDRVDLQALGLSTKPFVMKGEFDVNLINSKPRQLQGEFYATSIQFADGKNIYTLDSIRLSALVENGIQHINFASPFGWANITGAYDYTKLTTEVVNMIRHHIQSVDSAAAMAKQQSSQQATIAASLKWPRNLEQLAPDLHMPRPLILNGRLNTDSSLIILNGTLPYIRYGEFRIDSTIIDIASNSDSLNGKISFARMRHPSISLQRTTLSSHASNGEMAWDLRLLDKDDQLKYLVAGELDFLNENGFDIRLARSIVLDSILFSTDTANLISIRKGSLAKADLQLVAGEQRISVHTGTSTAGTLPPAEIKLEAFRISSITGMLDKDTALADGELNGTINITHAGAQTLLGAKITVDSLTVTGIPMGKFALELSTPAAGSYKVDASLTGNNNDVKVNGIYADVMDFAVQLNQLNLTSLEPFTQGQARRMSGIAKGAFTIKGTSSAPKINGSLNFEEAKANITYLNSQLTLKNETLVFNENGIIFNDFALTDSLGGQADINGRVLTTDYSDFAFDLRVNTSNFRVLGPKSDDEQMFYGPAHIDSRIRIEGNQSLPRINMSVRLLDKSNVTVVLPEEKMGITSREGVIVFVDRDNPPDSSLLEGMPVTDTAYSDELKGFAFSGDIEITKASTITIVVDKVNGDYLETKGTAHLSLSIDPTSNMSLTGKYEIEEGKYEMSLNQLIKRSFTIDKGSSITWNGDPLDADVDITAKHVVRAPAIDLIGDQVTEISGNRNRLKQRIPVEVYLIIKEELMKPEISFRLDMEEKDRNIFNGAMYTRLKQINNIPSELNKQVMGLLVLQTFISDDPLSALDESGGGISYAAMRSVSKVLSQQLNNLAANLIKGVDLNFDLQTQEDYSTGERSELTTLSVGASKSLFNDRLTVAVGSNIGIAGANAGNASALIGDVTVDYALSRDGRYKIRAYQRNQTDAVLEGQIIETGLSFILVMDYNRFREIFRKTKEEQQATKTKKKK